MWVALYYAQKKKLPWDDPESRFLKIPLTDEQKRFLEKSPMKSMFQTNGSWNDVNMGFFNRPLERGSKALGMDAAYNTHNAGGSFGQVSEYAQTQVLNSFIGPFVGAPTTKALFVAATGREPYITNMRDLTGAYAPQFFKGVETQSAGSQTFANVAQAAMDINPLLGRTAEAMGFSYKPVYGTEDEASGHVLRMVTDMFMPNLLKPHIDNWKMNQRLRKQLKASNTRARKENPGAGGISK